MAGSQKIVLMKDFIRKIIQKRTKKIINLFEEFIKEDEKILDIGAGGGWIGQEIQNRKNAKVTLLDIISFNRTDLKLVLYDGKNIPFPDNAFDTSLLIFTLHHGLNPLKVLEEAKRVSREKIIIIEDIPTSLINKIFLYAWDVITNLPSLINPPGENITFNFKTTSQWQKIFNDLQLKIIFQKEFQSNKLIRHALFVAAKN